MNSDEHFPFGRTDVSVEEIADLVDTERAAEIAEKNGVKDASERMRNLISKVPGLLRWLERHGRIYPWRETTDPWRVLVSEILLQRTRADAVAGTYNGFFERFPDPGSLNAASEEEVRDTVEPLGFVNHRVRTLKDVARIIVGEHGGDIPDSLEELKEPWRVGEYSARACQLFARGKPLALVDVNFARVFGRVLGVDMPSQPHRSVEVYALIDALVPGDPGIARAFNLAILDLGSQVCTPESPDCESCPLQACCDFWERNGIRA